MDTTRTVEKYEYSDTYGSDYTETSRRLLLLLLLSRCHVHTSRGFIRYRISYNFSKRIKFNIGNTEKAIFSFLL